MNKSNKQKKICLKTIALLLNQVVQHQLIEQGPKLLKESERIRRKYKGSSKLLSLDEAKTCWLSVRNELLLEEKLLDQRRQLTSLLISSLKERLKSNNKIRGLLKKLQRQSLLKAKPVGHS